MFCPNRENRTILSLILVYINYHLIRVKIQVSPKAYRPSIIKQHAGGVFINR